ncbi:MAG: nuclear transport factor 2 family protein [Pseudomonadota bacterium]
MTNLEIAEALFVATAAADADGLRALCASTLEATQNGGPAMGVDGLIQFAAVTNRAVKNFRYENALRTETAQGFVEEHDVVCDLPDGSGLRLRVCVVANVDAGQITQLREYADGYAARGLMKAIAAVTS